MKIRIDSFAGKKIVKNFGKNAATMWVKVALQLAVWQT